MGARGGLMKIASLFLGVLILAAIAPGAQAAASLTMRLLGDGQDGRRPATGQTNVLNVGQTVTLIVEVTGAKVTGQPALPAVSGLTLNGSGVDAMMKNKITFNYFLTPSRAGNMVIPSFDIRTTDGQTLHTGPLRLAVKGK
jgi:hypothetical protein